MRRTKTLTIHQVQVALCNHGHKLTLTNFLDHPTKKALLKFQAARKLPQTGTLSQSTIDALQGQNTNHFYCSGDLGDIIYALLVIRALGGGFLILGPESNQRCREPINRLKFENIAPLLRIQPYVHGVKYSPTVPSNVIDLNQFRSLRFDLKASLASIMLRYFGQDETDVHKAWLTVDVPVFHYPVIINRSQRYQEIDFPWKKIIQKYSHLIGFVGDQPEHDDFCGQYGPVPYVKTPTLLNLARVIAASQLFIGNQSCAYAIAEGLKHQTIQETWSYSPNCVFERSNAIYTHINKDIKLPELTFKAPDLLSDIGPKTLVIHGPVDGFSGYGQTLNHLIIELTKLGHPVNVLPTAVDNAMCSVPDTTKKVIINQTNSHKLVFHTHDAFPNILEHGDVIFTMWESTRMKQEAVESINSKAIGCIVPSTWNASCFSAQGVKIPIKVTHLGIDPNTYYLRQSQQGGTCIFGAAGRFAHGGSRKGLEEVIVAFKKAFPTETDVQLQVKLFMDCKVKEDSDPRVVFNRQFLSSSELADWYANITAFVSASKGEGWGLHHLQAMAVGRPVICTQFAGTGEFFDASVGYPVEFDLKICDGFYVGFGLWAVPKEESIIEQMRQVYNNRDAALELGLKSAERAKKFTWENSAKSLKSHLIDFNLL